MLISLVVFVVVTAPLSAAAWWLWRAARPWDYRPRTLAELFSRRTNTASRQDDDGFRTRETGFVQLAPEVPLEADLSGWMSAHCLTLAELVQARPGHLVVKPLHAAVGRGERRFLSPGQETRLNVSPFQRLEGDLEQFQRLGEHVTVEHPSMNAFLVGRRVIVLGPACGLALEFSPSTKSSRVERLLKSLRPTQLAEADTNFFLRLQLVNDGQLADTLEQTPGEVAFEAFAPGLHLLFVERRDRTHRRVLGSDEVGRIGRQVFFERMKQHVPYDLVLKSTAIDDVLINSETIKDASTAVVQPEFQRRMHERFGERFLVCVPSASHVVVARDEARCHTAIDELLRRYALEGDETWLSRSIYRVEAGRWSVSAAPKTSAPVATGTAFSF
jgi:hypothetical protein